MINSTKRNGKKFKINLNGSNEKTRLVMKFSEPNNYI